MLEYFKHISDLIFDNSKSWGKRTSILFSLIFLLIIADFTFNITFNIFTENKLSQLEKITKLKEEYKNDNNRLNEIKSIENEVFKREHYSEFLSRNFTNLTSKNNKKEENGIIRIEDKRSMTLMVLSSNTILIVIVFFILLMPIFGGKEARQSNFFIGFFSSLLFISFLISVITIISYQIPTINNNPKWNYLLNLLIQLFFYWIFYRLFKKSNNKNVA